MSRKGDAWKAAAVRRLRRHCSPDGNGPKIMGREGPSRRHKKIGDRLCLKAGSSLQRFVQNLLSVPVKARQVASDSRLAFHPFIMGDGLFTANRVSRKHRSEEVKHHFSGEHMQIPADFCRQGGSEQSLHQQPTVVRPASHGARRCRRKGRETPAHPPW